MSRQEALCTCALHLMFVAGVSFESLSFKAVADNERDRRYGGRGWSSMGGDSREQASVRHVLSSTRLL